MGHNLSPNSIRHFLYTSYTTTLGFADGFGMQHGVQFIATNEKGKPAPLDLQPPNKRHFRCRLEALGQNEIIGGLQLERIISLLCLYRCT